MPGVVFGTRAGDAEADSRLQTRLDFDQAFGTVVNRFCCQFLAGHPITVYGNGLQKRTFLSLRDAVKGIGLALDNPPEPGQLRVLNHFSDTHSIIELALKVSDAARDFGLESELGYYENPRAGDSEHFHDAQIEQLLDLGFSPDRDFDSELRVMFEDLIVRKERVQSRRYAFVPDVRWDGSREEACLLPPTAAARAAV